MQEGRRSVEKMKYAEMAYVKNPVSRIFFGTATSSALEGSAGSELLDFVYGSGITAFDTARVYGQSETLLGKWIEEKNMREKIVILSKCGHPDLKTWEKRVNEKAMWEDLETSLKELRTDFLDIYLLHRDDPDVETGEIVEIFNGMHAEGKIGAFGGSNWTHERIEQANEYAYKHNLILFTVSSPNFGLADQAGDPWGGGCVTISGPKEVEAREWYRKQNMPVVAYSSLAHGLLAGKVKSTDWERVAELLDAPTIKGYGSEENFERLRRCEILAAEKQATVAQIAMAYIFHQDLNVFAVVSASKPERMKENIEALQIPLTKEEAAWLDLRREKR